MPHASDGACGHRVVHTGGAGRLLTALPGRSAPRAQDSKPPAAKRGAVANDSDDDWLDGALYLGPHRAPSARKPFLRHTQQPTHASHLAPSAVAPVQSKAPRVAAAVPAAVAGLAAYKCTAGPPSGGPRSHGERGLHQQGPGPRPPQQLAQQQQARQQQQVQQQQLLQQQGCRVPAPGGAPQHRQQQQQQARRGAPAGVQVINLASLDNAFG